MTVGSSTGAPVVPVAPAAARRRPLLLTAACVAVAVSMIDTTIVTVALPDLQRDSGLDLYDLEWLVNSYLVVFTALTLAGGVLSDRFGRRRLLLTGLAVFAAGSLLTALGHPAGGWDEVRVGRVIQGLGAALSEPATLAVLREGYGEGRARARALGLWAAAAGLAIALGPVIGGLLVALGGWRAVFLFNVPAAAIAFGLVLAGVPAGDQKRQRAEAGRARLDLPGLVLGAVVLAGVAFGLLEQQERGFSSGLVIGSLVAAAVAAALLVPVERRARQPALPLDIAIGRRTVAANAGALAASFAVFAIFFLVTLVLQILGRVSALGTAGAFAPMVVVLAAGALAAGRLDARGHGRATLGAGLLIAALGMLATRQSISVDPSVGDVVGPLLVVGLGLGLVLAPAASIVLAATEPARAGVAAATVNLARQLGGLLAVAILGAVTVGRLSGSLDGQLSKLGLDASYHDQVFAAIIHPGRGGVVTRAPSAGAGLIAQARYSATRAAESAFTSGVRLALTVSLVVLVVAALLVLVSPRATATTEGAA